ncbi:hypothetical protein HDU87_005958 [Geranomyces variabilis]|uniref:Uncharacterized protein n=1 Tax=Geranomyces variabilis TaxID=109894 RepID=A0AAD5TV02_9FUNG|nr:hypothetical protein HDU87_005958 [Geranomyces variabilis]
MENPEEIRLRRAVTLFEHIAADKKKDDAVRRDRLAEHIRKQKEVLDRRQEVLAERRTDTDLAGERDRKRFLIERRKKQFAVAGGRVPTPLEQLHPASPHYHKPAPAAQLDPLSGGRDPGSTAAAAAQASGSTSSLQAAALFKQAPTHTGSGKTLSEPETADMRAATRATHSVFKSDAYRREARELRELRTPHTPGLRAPPLSEERARLPDLEGVRPRIDSRRRGRRRTTGAAMTRGPKKSAGRGRPESGGANTERDLAIEAVFSTEGAYREFKQKYEKPVDVGMPVETEMHEAVLIERQVPERLATKRAMYTTATRNRQRTVTFARSGGVSGGTATAITAIPAFPSTPLHAQATAATSGMSPLPPGTAAAAGGIEPGLEAFGPHFAHTVTDAAVPVPDIDATDQAAAEAAYALALEAELAAIKRPVSSRGASAGGSPERKRQASLWSSRPGTRSRLSNAYESLMASRPPSVLANPTVGGGRRMSSAPSPNAGGTPAARRASVSRPGSVADTTTAVKIDSLPISRRGSLTRQEVLAIAAEQMGKGRRGPSAHGERSNPSTDAAVPAIGASGGGGGAGGERPAGLSASSAKRGTSSAGATEGKPPRENVYEHSVPPIFSTAVREEDEGEIIGSDDDEAEAAASGGGSPQPLDEEGYASTNLPFSDVGDGALAARREDPAGLPYGRRKAPRVVRSWQPISLCAASDCKKTIIPTALFKLPSLSCRNAAAAAAEEIYVPVLAARFWNPPN